jgi:hypothetical protein
LANAICRAALKSDLPHFRCSFKQKAPNEPIPVNNWDALREKRKGVIAVLPPFSDSKPDPQSNPQNARSHDFSGLRRSPRVCKSLKNLRAQDCHSGSRAMVRGKVMIGLGRVRNDRRSNRQVDTVPEGSISPTKTLGYIWGYLRSCGTQVVQIQNIWLPGWQR